VESSTVGRETRRDRQKRRTREKIVVAARQLFLGQGYEATTLSQIADRADIASSTLFTHFTSKADIFFADYDLFIADFIRALRDRDREQETAIEATIRWNNEWSAQDVGLDPAWFECIRSLIDADTFLPSLESHFYDAGVKALAQELATDLGESETDVTPRVIAATALALYLTVPRFRIPSGPYTSAEVIDYANNCFRAMAKAIISVPSPKDR
jgi:AcrR family transcriptional regulator